MRAVERIEDNLGLLTETVGRESRADRARDEKIMALADDILADLDAAETEQEGFKVLLQSLIDNQGDPVKLQQIASSVKSQKEDWVNAFANVPRPNPPTE